MNIIYNRIWDFLVAADAPKEILEDMGNLKKLIELLEFEEKLP